MFIHLAGLTTYVTIIPGASVILPLILWTLKKHESRFIEEQGREVLNFQISVLIYTIAAGILCFVVVGFALLPVVILFHLIATIVGTVKVASGTPIEYPLAIKFV